MTYAGRLITVVVLGLGGCRSSTPLNQIVVPESWSRVSYHVVSWGGSTEIDIQPIGSHHGFVTFELREGLKAVAGQTTLDPQEMSSLRATLPAGTVIAGNHLVVDAPSYTVSIDGQSATTNLREAEPALRHVVDWFIAYAATLRHSATTRPWFEEAK